MGQLAALVTTPLGQLLGGIHESVFRKLPEEISTRDLARSMGEKFRKLRENGDYAVVTNRGIPSFLIIPIPEKSWMGLLMASTPTFNPEEVEGSAIHAVDEL